MKSSSVPITARMTFITRSCKTSTVTTPSAVLTAAPRVAYSFGAINCGTATAAQLQAAVLENFSRGRPSSYTYQVPQPGRTLDDAIATFSLKNIGLFLQDTWDVNKQLTLTAGLRIDGTRIGEKPLYNARAAQATVGSYDANRSSDRRFRHRQFAHHRWRKPVPATRWLQLQAGIGTSDADSAAASACSRVRQ